MTCVRARDGRRVYSPAGNLTSPVMARGTRGHPHTLFACWPLTHWERNPHSTPSPAQPGRLPTHHHRCPTHSPPLPPLPYPLTTTTTTALPTRPPPPPHGRQFAITSFILQTVTSRIKAPFSAGGKHVATVSPCALPHTHVAKALTHARTHREGVKGRNKRKGNTAKGTSVSSAQPAWQ